MDEWMPKGRFSQQDDQGTLQGPARQAEAPISKFRLTAKPVIRGFSGPSKLVFHFRPATGQLD